MQNEINGLRRKRCLTGKSENMFYIVLAVIVENCSGIVFDVNLFKQYRIDRNNGCMKSLVVCINKRCSYCKYVSTYEIKVKSALEMKIF